MSDDDVLERFSDCDEYFRTFPVAAVTEGDKEKIDTGFKIAFSHQVHMQIGILEMFLAVLFR